MALTQTNVRQGVTVDGRRKVTINCSFSDGTAANVSNASLGLRVVDEVNMLLKTASGITVNVTGNDGTNVQLTPSGAGAHDIVFVGH